MPRVTVGTGKGANSRWSGDRVSTTSYQGQGHLFHLALQGSSYSARSNLPTCFHSFATAARPFTARDYIPEQASPSVSFSLQACLKALHRYERPSVPTAASLELLDTKKLSRGLSLSGLLLLLSEIRRRLPDWWRV